MVATLDVCRTEAALHASGIDALRLRSSSAPFPMWLIDTAGLLVQSLEPLLSEEERVRADRFNLSALRSRYIAAHGGLRLLLRDRYGIPIEAQILDVNDLGKPSLKHFPALHYNMSYSGSHVLIGVCEGNEIGVDIEVSRTIEDAAELMETHFTETEQAGVRREGAPLGLPFSRAFLKVWARKEACVKAFGCGLGIELKTLECAGGDEPATVWLNGNRCNVGVVPFIGTPIMAWACRS